MTPAYRGRHRRLEQRSREARLLEPGYELSGRYVLRDRLNPAEPVSFRADDALLNRSVTVTFINLDSDYAELIYGSDRVPGISGLWHRALARLFDVGHEVGVDESFIVTDYVAGCALSELLEQQPASLGEHPLSTHVAELLADLVSYLKAHGLVHTDLSPGNIRIALPSRESDATSAEHPLVRVGLVGLHSDPAGQPDQAPVARRT